MPTRKNEGYELARTSRVPFQKQRCLSCKKTIEDEDDVFTGKINTGLLLFFGVLSVTTSAILVVYSAVLAFHRQELLMEFLKTVIFAAPFSVIGFVSLYYVFQKDRTRKLEKSLPLGLALPQSITCEKCGAILYEGEESTLPYEIIESYGSRCPRCGELLISTPTDIEVKEIATSVSQESIKHEAR